MKILKIAGTSVGGSSYSTRLLRHIVDNANGETLRVIITKGEKQDSVYVSVLRQARMIEDAASKLSGKACSFSFLIEKE